MSKIKNGGLDQYGKVLSLNGIGSERVNDIAIIDSSLVNWCRVKKSLSETKPDDVDLFTKNVQTFVKDVLANFKEYQLFCGSYILPEFNFNSPRALE